MREYVEHLIELLEKEYQFYQELENILIEERNALVNFDNEKLTDLNFQKESLLLNIIEIKNKRDEILEEIGQIKGIDKDNINLTFLSLNIPEYKDTFKNYKERFRSIGQKIESLNQINKHVINSSLNFIKSSLNIIYQNSNKSTYSNYGKISDKINFGAAALYTSKV